MDEHTEPTADQGRGRGPAPGDFPERVGSYRLRRRIGAGGMGVVFEAADEKLGRPVAVKFIGEARHDPEIRRRFRQELDTLSRLRHPAIAHIYDAGEADIDGSSMPYFVMEYVVGAETITSFAEGLGDDTGRLLEVFESIFDGLDHAHRKGIVHRDLKPGNVLVDGDGRAKIIDFGLSLPTGARDAFVSLDAEAGLTAGTPRYMSPEQAAGYRHAIDHRTDIYSLGKVLGEVLDRVRSIDSETETGIRAIVRRATAARPADRFDSAADARDALRRCRDRVTTMVSGFQPVEARKSFDPRVALAAAVGGLLGAFALFPRRCLGTPVCSWYAAAAAAWHGGAETENGYDHVRVVTITSDTFADERVTGGGQPIRPTDLRAVHAEIIEKLVDADAGVIAFDVRFESETEHDAGLIGAIRGAVDAGVPVLLMDHDWAANPEDRTVDPEIAAAASAVAPANGRMLADLPWLCVVAARPEGGFLLPGYALTAAELATAGTAMIDLEAQISGQTVLVRRYHTDEQGNRVAEGPAVSYPVSSWGKALPNHAGIGLRPGDDMAQVVIEVPPDETLARHSVPYEDALAMNADALRESVRGRVVVIGWIDELGNDLHPHPGGRRVAGAYLQAGAIEHLLEQRVLRGAPDLAMRSICLLAGVAGALAWGLGAPTRSRRMLRLGAVAAGAALCCVAALAASYIVFPTPVAASVLAGGGAAWALALRTPAR